MGKNGSFLGRSKWGIIIMLLAALWLTTKYPQETKEESFIQIGKEVIKDYLTKRMLYS